MVEIEWALALDRHEIAISATNFSSSEVNFLGSINPEIDDSEP